MKTRNLGYIRGSPLLEGTIVVQAHSLGDPFDGLTLKQGGEQVFMWPIVDA